MVTLFAFIFGLLKQWTLAGVSHKLVIKYWEKLINSVCVCFSGQLWVSVSGGKVMVFDASSWSLTHTCQVGNARLVRTTNPQMDLWKLFISMFLSIDNFVRGLQKREAGGRLVKQTNTHKKFIELEFRCIHPSCEKELETVCDLLNSSCFCHPCLV